MYRKDSDGWLKHTDFIVLDMICLQLAYLLAYEIRGHTTGPYETMLYRNMAIFLELADLIVIFAFDTMKSVLKRGHYVEFSVTLKHVVMVGALAVLYLFLLQQGEDYSRLTLILTFVIYAVLTYGARELWKECLYKKMKDGGERELLILSLIHIYPSCYREQCLPAGSEPADGLPENRPGGGRERSAL